MKINDLRNGQGSVEIEATVKDIEEEKTFNKFGRELKLQNIIIEDDSGSIKLTLWNQDAGRFEVGDKIKVHNGYVKEFKDEKQLTSGKFGKIEKVEKGNAEEKTSPKVEESEEIEELDDEIDEE